MSRSLASLALVLALAFTLGGTLGACAPSISDVRLFYAKPPVPYRVLGLVNGGGPNEASAMQAMLQNAANLGANGVIVRGTRMLGNQHIAQAEAIQYQGDLPPANVQPTGAPMGAPQPPPY